MRTAEETRLRDEFAGITLGHLMRLHKFDSALSIEYGEDYVSRRRHLAVHAYLMADEMLYVRTKNLNSYKD